MPSWLAAVSDVALSAVLTDMPAAALLETPGGAAAWPADAAQDAEEAAQDGQAHQHDQHDDRNLDLHAPGSESRSAFYHRLLKLRLLSPCLCPMHRQPMMQAMCTASSVQAHRGMLTHLRTVGSSKWLTAWSIRLLLLVLLLVGVGVLEELPVGPWSSTFTVAGTLSLVGLLVGVLLLPLEVSLVPARTSVVAGPLLLLLLLSRARRERLCSARAVCATTAPPAPAVAGTLLSSARL